MAAQTVDTMEEASGAFGGYRMSWLTVNALLREGRSWSGYERNNCYLNIGEGAMANIAAVSGLDFIDDGRGLGFTDWDQDGDMDVWLSNRTGPVLRFMRNNADATTASVSVRLIPRRSNRDAVGARVRVIDGSGRPQLKTVRAGEGYLSQSSKWLVFGLGENPGTIKVSVRWPGDSVYQEIAGVSGPGRYEVVEGKAATRMTDRGPVSLAGSTLDAPPTSLRARVPLLSRVPFPHLRVTNVRGEAERLKPPPGKPTLVNLWGSWCGSCSVELTALNGASDLVSKTGLQVLALGLDRIGKAGGDEQQARRIMRPLTGGHMRFYWADNAAVDVLEALHKTVCDTSVRLPLPSSFLLDTEGRVCALYRGPVAVAQVEKDLEMLKSKDAWRRGLAPFPGTRQGWPAAMDPIQLALKLFEGGFAGQTRDYVGQLIELVETGKPGGEHVNRAQIHYFMGTLLEESKRSDRSVHAYQYAVRADPGHFEARRNLGRLLLQSGQYAGAETHLRAAWELRSDRNIAIQLGRALAAQGKLDEMIGLLSPMADDGDRSAALEISWMLATASTATDAHHKLALERVRALVAGMDGEAVPAFVSEVYAAAAAVNGDFKTALSEAAKALEGTKGAGRQRVEKAMEAYRAGRAR